MEMLARTQATSRSPAGEDHRDAGSGSPFDPGQFRGADPGNALAAAVRTGWPAALPLPGSGRTVERWASLARVSAQNVTLGRILEAHADALAIVAELATGKAVADWAGPQAQWGVWAAEQPGMSLTATAQTSGWAPRGGQPAGGARDHEQATATASSQPSWQLCGTKPWCSGAPFLTHALVTAGGPGGRRLYAVALADSGVRVASRLWACSGMRDSATVSVAFDEVAAVPIGRPGDYLDRPGFWHGAVGVAACWFGGAAGIARALWAAARQRQLDPHALAHLGAVDAALNAGWSVLREAAAAIDADPTDAAGQGERRALQVRAVIESTAQDVVHRVGRALGPAPLVTDPEHAGRVEDLTVYLRQSHAERDLARLGELAAALAPAW